MKLACAIAELAVKDYLRGLRIYKKTGKITKEVIENEKFFRSEWFHFLTNLDGEDVILTLRKQVLND